MSNLLQRGLPCPFCLSSDARAEYEENYYCFSCKRSTVKEGKRSKWELGSLILPSNSELPSDFSPDITVNEKSYLYKLHFTDYLISKYNIGHSESSPILSKGKICQTGPRLILPYFKEGNLLFWEGKCLDGTSPLKYITYGGKQELFTTFEGSQEIVVVVEDILSAMRVGEICPSISLRGTKLTDLQLYAIVKVSKTVVLWLDSDGPGKIAQQKIATRLGWGCNVKLLQTEHDPKYYSDDKIKELLEPLRGG